MTDEEKIVALAREFTPFDLPIGVYVVTKDGKFIECNTRVREIMGLPLNGSIEASIAAFYREPGLREEILRRIEETESIGKWLEKQPIPFKVGPREIIVQDYARSIRDPETHEVIGYICCMVDITEEEQYHHMFESLPIGVYRLDANDCVVNANQALVKILGYDSASQIEGRPVADFYANREGASKSRQEIEERDSIVNRTVELLKMNGESIFTSVSAHKISLEGKYAGREGTMMDVTTEERYRRIMEDVPVGLYEVRTANGRDVIRHCNEQFAIINEFDSKEDALDFDMRDLHSSPEDYTHFIDALKQEHESNRPLHGYPLRVKGRKGKNLVFEVNSRVLSDRKTGRIIGRAGAVRDITEEAALKDKVREFTDDIGNVLHAYTHTLLMVQHSVSPVIQSLGPSLFDRSKRVSTEEAVASLSGPTRALVDALNTLCELAQSEDRRSALSEQQWSQLFEYLHTLREYEQIVVHVEAQPPTLREAASRVLTIVNDIQGKIARELIVRVRNGASEVVQLCNLISLRQARDAVIEMDHQVRSLREYVISGARLKEQRTVFRTSVLVNRAIVNLSEFARSRGVVLRRMMDADPLVEVVERDVVRALTNLLHNSIKYSWRRSAGAKPRISNRGKAIEAPRVMIRIQVVQSQVEIQFENWGVPIPQDEIEHELVFRIGFRGRLSSDRRRVGTGIGLTDARNVAREHGGEVTIESRPASSGGAKDDYSKPFLTSALMRLPVYIERGGRK